MAEPLHADQVASRGFPTSFRGFDQHEVRSFLGQVAAELATTQERERALLARVAELESAEPAALDEAALEAALGHEATRVIHAAREAAADIRERAEANAAKILQEANERHASARAEGDAILDDARRAADELASTIVAEAELTRDKVLRDLQRKRKQVLVQLEQLHEARSRLEGAYDAVRAALDAAVAEVAVADDDAVAIAAAAVAPAADTPASPEAEPDPEPAAAPAPEPEPVAGAVDADADAAPEPAQHEPPRESEDGRRSSALRVLHSAPPLADDAVEGVRVIRPAAPPAPPPVSVTAAPVTTGDEPSDPAAEHVVPVVAEIAETAPELPPQPAAEHVADTAEPDPAPVVDVSSDPDAVPVAATPEPAEAAAVGDLFARLRADRAEKTAAAVAVLAGPVVDAEKPESEPIVASAPTGDAALLVARDGAIAEIERTLVRAIKRALADEQNEVLDALRRLKGKPNVAAIMPDIAVHDARYETVLGSATSTAAALGGTGDGAGVAAELGRGVAADLRGRIGRVVDDAAGDIETLIDAISATYREWKSSRTEPLARDVVTAAYARGAYDAAAGDLRWVVDPAEGGCPDCDDNALAGPTPKGTAFPTGQLHPPAHAGCRCIVVAATT